jgi:hypothetical protein
MLTFDLFLRVSNPETTSLSLTFKPLTTSITSRLSRPVVIFFSVAIPFSTVKTTFPSWREIIVSLGITIVSALFSDKMNA